MDQSIELNCMEQVVEFWTKSVYPEIFQRSNYDASKLHCYIKLFRLSLYSLKRSAREKAIIANFLADLYRIDGSIERMNHMLELCIELDPKRKKWYLSCKRNDFKQSSNDEDTR